MMLMVSVLKYLFVIEKYVYLPKTVDLKTGRKSENENKAFLYDEFLSCLLKIFENFSLQVLSCN